MAKAVSKKAIHNKIVKNMKELGTYRPQYAETINVYADLLFQYEILSARFAEEGYQISVSTERNGEKKNPLLTALENLRKDIGTYSDRLRLNAKTYETEVEAPKEEKSAFAKLLEAQKANDG